MFLLGALACAAPPPAEIVPLVTRPRPGAPEWVEVRVPGSRAGLREGALEFLLSDEERGSLRYRTNEIALIGTPQRFRFLLPGSSQLERGGAEEMRVRFVEKDGVSELGHVQPPPNFRSERPLVVAVVREEGGRGPGCWPALRLERYAPSSGANVWAGVATQAAHFDPADLPVDPLGYCAFDVVAVESGAFARVREKARVALARWVEAGGSLCVVLGPGADAEQLATLNQLGGIDPKWTALTGAEPFAYARANYGRLVVAAAPPADEPAQTSPDWRRACAFLWKLRAAQAGEILQKGNWQSPDPKHAWNSWRSLTFAQNLYSGLGKLMPDEVRLIPGGVLVALGVGFILLVGPGDWCLLGALRHRRWTWLLFPAIAIGVTALTVWLARHYMGTATQRRAIIITDLGLNGRVVRETRIEMVLPARNQMESNPLTHALVSPNARDYGHRDACSVSGQFPARYTVERPLRQWSPLFQRTLSFVDGEDTSGVRWAAFDAAEGVKPWTENLARKLSPQLEHSFDLFQGSTYQTSGAGAVDQQWRFAMSATKAESLGHLLTQLSPTGSATLDDLPCFELGDVSRTLLVATKRDGNDIRVWRRLYLR